MEDANQEAKLAELLERLTAYEIIEDDVMDLVNFKLQNQAMMVQLGLNPGLPFVWSKEGKMNREDFLSLISPLSVSEKIASLESRFAEIETVEEELGDLLSLKIQNDELKEKLGL